MKNKAQYMEVIWRSIMNPVQSAWGFRLWNICIIILLGCGTISPLSGGIQSLAPKVDAHVYYVKSGKEMLPIIGVESQTRVVVIFSDKERKSIKYRQVGWAELNLSPVGRVTVCGSKGRTEWEQYVSEDFISTMGTTYFTFDLVADRFIPNCYIALIMEFPDQSENKVISFSKLGDLPAGELINKDVVFHNIIAPEGSSYVYEFYMGGLPVEQFILSEVAGNPRSKSLLIPWDLRLKQFLISAKDEDITRQVRPFHRNFRALNLSAIKSREIKELKITILVKKDGSIELKKGDPQLTDNEQSLLSEDVKTWQFLPAVKEGKPYDMRVAVPLRL